MSHTPPKAVDHEALRREITESMESIESLAQQMKGASKAEIAEIRRSGKEDFKLDGGDVSDVLESADYLLKAFEAEKGPKPDEAASKKFRERARAAVRGTHRYAKEEFLR